MARKQFGLCRLTGVSGQYVKAHIIPKSLTRPESPEMPFTQSGKGQLPIRRWGSWSDERLVVRKGENVLEALDTWAVPVLRDHQLVWNGWREARRLPVSCSVYDAEGRGYRIVNGFDTNQLRLFLLSLLWRAAASSLPEMSEIAVPEDDLKFFGSLLLDDDPGPVSFYPAQLIQLSTRGLTHNHTPIASTKIIPFTPPNILRKEIPIFRFYFDGLIVHFHKHSADDGYTASLGNLVVGNTNEIAVTTVPYEISFQAANLQQSIEEAESKFPTVLDRLAWPPKCS